MKRLTFRTDMGDDLLDAIAFLNPDDAGGMYNLRDIGEYGSDELLLEIANRLAEYEDIGLEPEKIVFLKNVVDDAFSNKPEFTEHIRELLRAEKDGRLVILPCKVGERIYQVIPDYTAPDNSLFIEEDVFHLGLLTDGGELPANCYFTLEEAEKALAEEVCKENT